MGRIPRYTAHFTAPKGYRGRRRKAISPDLEPRTIIEAASRTKLQVHPSTIYRRIRAKGYRRFADVPPRVWEAVTQEMEEKNRWKAITEYLVDSKGMTKGAARKYVYRCRRQGKSTAELARKVLAGTRKIEDEL